MKTLTPEQVRTIRFAVNWFRSETEEIDSEVMCDSILVDIPIGATVKAGSGEASLYFLEKEAEYSHGVFWVGEDLNFGKSLADKLAAMDVDSHHGYSVYEFGILNAEKMPAGNGGNHHDYVHDPEHKLIYKTDNSKTRNDATVKVDPPDPDSSND